MKKLLSVLLVLALCCCALLTFATADTINITFDGVWYNFSFYGFSLYLPSYWYEYESSEVAYVFGNQRGTQTMIVDVLGSDYYSMNNLYQSMSSNRNFQGVEYLTFNGIDFVTYDMPNEDAYGLVTLSEDRSLVYYFEFSPYNDDELTNLAVQIMASISTFTPTFGSVVITGGNGINVRAGDGTEYAVLAKVYYGEVYDVVAISPRGWYGLEMTDGSIGYISPKVCTFVY